MAHVITYESGFGGVGAWLARIRKAVADDVRYLRTLGELQALSDRELSDIGLTRFMIREVAHQSIYGR